MKYTLNSEETHRLRFRSVETSDYDSWIDFFKDPSSFTHWIEERKSPEAACSEWFQKQLARYKANRGGMNALIEKTSGKLIGYGGLLVQNVDEIQELEIAYSLLPSYRNKGFATEAAFKCMNHAFENGFTDSLISIISTTNTPSANVAIKNGMKVEKQTTYRENRVNIFRITKKEWLRNAKL